MNNSSLKKLFLFLQHLKTKLLVVIKVNNKIEFIDFHVINIVFLQLPFTESPYNLSEQR
jgi:hypothetical protein